MLFALFVVPGLTSSAGLVQVVGSVAPLLALTLRNGAFALLILYLLDIQGDRTLIAGVPDITAAPDVRKTVSGDDSPRTVPPGDATAMPQTSPTRRGAVIATTVLVWAILLGTSLAVSAVTAAFGFDSARGASGEILRSLAASSHPAVWIPVVIAAMVSVGIVEELFFRAYLVARLRQTGASPRVAVGVAALLFSVGHGYQGPSALVFSFIAGAGLGLLWLKRPRLSGFAAGHAAYNLTALVLAAWYT